MDIYELFLPICHKSFSPTGNWGTWGSWNSCPVTCGGGTRTRYRSCNGGSSCPGLSYETTPCSTAQCPGGC